VTPLELEARLEQLPTRPGVYLMKDRQGRIIYVGKAVNLHARVRSYFHKGTSDSRPFIQLLDRLLGDIETVVVGTEKEALLLENELIKKHHPRFNVQLRDDKNFLLLRLDLSHPFPRLETVRRTKKDKARYFGPYSSAGSIRETLRVVNRFFGLRTCNDHVLETRHRPCLLHQIGRCPAPCVLPVSPEGYRQSVEAVALFLDGRSGPLLETLRARMKLASSKLEFEEAARVRDQMVALERSLEKQAVATPEAIDQDVFSVYREGDRVTLYALHIRGGRMSGGRSHHVRSEFPDDELLASLVNQYFSEGTFIPREVLLDGAEESCAALTEVLSEKAGTRVKVLCPRRGDKVELLKLAKKNAAAAFSERKKSDTEVEEVLERLKERLHLPTLPRTMECIDISHFQGTSVVASVVASENTESVPSRYLRLQLKSVLRNDDFAAVHEVMTRRLKRGHWPDLFVIDGGKGQLNAALAAVKDLKLEGVNVVSLAKSRDLETVDRDATNVSNEWSGAKPGFSAESGFASSNEWSGAKPGFSAERVFLPLRRDPIVLSQTSPELFALTRLRDEAHRFAITYQRKKSRKRGLQSELDEIPGVGEQRKRALLLHFGSVKQMRAASIEEMAQVEGMGPASAERLHAFLNGSRAETDDLDEVREQSLEEAAQDAPDARQVRHTPNTKME
jgi:excinuclease ABC subunit C